MFHCEIWCGSDELHTRRVSGLFPIGYEMEVDGHLGTEYIVEGGKIFLEHGTMDVRVEVYVREKPKEMTGEILAAMPWRSIPYLGEDASAETAPTQP